MSKTSAIIVIILGVAIVALSLWVRDLKADIEGRDKTISTLNKTNSDLSASNQTLIASVETERNAVRQREATIAQLKEELAVKKGKYNEATANDKCANTDAPAAVIELVR